MHKLLAPLIALLAAACTYLPDEEYFNTIPQSDPVTSISLENYNEQDTIFVYNITNLNFNVGTDKGVIKEVQVLVDNKLLTRTNSLSDDFQINENNYLKTGVYELKINFISSTGSGSYADKRDAEKITVWRTWTLVVEVDVPYRNSSADVKFSRENGFLKISWNPFLKPNFIKYELYIKNQNAYQGRTITITDPTKSFWIDSSFVDGGSAEYNVYAHTRYQGGGSGTKTFYSYNDFRLNYRASDSTALLSWRKAVYDRSFKQYTIQVLNETPITIVNVGDTTLALKLKNVILGRSTAITFKMQGQQGAYSPPSRTIDITNPVVLKKIAGAPKLIYNISRQAVIGLKNTGRLCVYNASLQVVDSVTLDKTNFPLPVQGNFAYFTNLSADVTQLNLLTLEKKTKSIASENGYRTGPWNISGTSTQLVSYDYISLINNYKYNEVIYDFATNTKVYSKIGASSNSTSSSLPRTYPRLSHDGRFAFYQQSIYLVNNGALQLIAALPTTGTFVDFRSDDNEEFFFQTTSGAIEVYNSNDVTLKRSIASPAANTVYQSFDAGTRHMLFQDQSDNIYIVDVATGNIKKHIKAHGSGLYSLVNGFLYRTDGVYLKVL